MKRFFVISALLLSILISSCDIGSDENAPSQQGAEQDGILSLSSLPQPTLTPSGVYKYSDVAYSDYAGADGSTTFNLYLPKSAGDITKDMPCVVYVHSGSWNSGNADEYDRFFEYGKEKYADSYVRKYGIPVISVNYRLLGKSDDILTWNCDYTVSAIGFTNSTSGELDYNLFSDNGNRISDQVKDIETLFKFIKKNASVLHIDPSFAILDGYSAGANLELLYVLNDEYEKPIEIKALIDRAGPADMSCNEYVRFFSDMITNDSYNVKTTVDVLFTTMEVDVVAEMKPSDKSGEVLLTTMLSSATGKNYSLGQLKQFSLSGLDSDSTPQCLKDISPAYHAKKHGFAKQPYIVMAYGDDVDLSISAKAGISGGVEVLTDLKGDPLAPRIAGEKLALALNSHNKNIISTEMRNGQTRIARNSVDRENGNVQYALYKGDFSAGEKIAFIGSASGGHDVCSKNDEQYSKHWSDAELSALRDLVDYAVQTVCGIRRTSSSSF